MHKTLLADHSLHTQIILKIKTICPEIIGIGDQNTTMSLGLDTLMIKNVLHAVIRN